MTKSAILVLLVCALGSSVFASGHTYYPARANTGTNTAYASYYTMSMLGPSGAALWAPGLPGTPNAYQSYYVSSNTPIVGVRTATWSIPLAERGYYNVDVTFGSYSSAKSNVKHVVTDKNGDTTYYVNQTLAGGLMDTWISLGTHEFDAGSPTTTRIKLTNDNQNTSGNLYVGALRFTKVTTGPTPSYANRPVVLLVRGLRPPLGTTDPYRYWAGAYSYLSNRLPNATIEPVGTDVFAGSGTIAAAGVKLKKRVEDRAAEGRDVYIVAHSMGGLVTRECLRLLRKYDKRGLVKGVFMLSSPNCGSHVADIAVSKAGITPSGGVRDWRAALALGILADGAESAKAAWDLRTDTVLKSREFWNDGFETFYLFGGTSTNGANAYSASSIVLRSWPDGTYNPNDGMVTAKSAFGISYHYGAYGAFDFPTLSGSRQWSYPLNHALIKDSTGVLSIIADYINRSISTGTMLAEGQSAPDVPASNDATGSEVLVNLSSGTVSSGVTNETVVPVDQLAPVTFSLTYLAGGPVFSLVRPDGVTINQADMQQVVPPSSSDDGMGRAIYTADAPQTGHWKLHVTGTAADSATDYTTSVSGTGTLVLSSVTPSVQVQSNCAVIAKVADGGIGIPGCAVAADCNYPDGSTTTVPLLDDGLHGDGAANDGVYGGAISNPAQGAYTALLHATGAFTWTLLRSTVAVRIILITTALCTGGVWGVVRWGASAPKTIACRR